MSLILKRMSEGGARANRMRVERNTVSILHV
jgi:hypothetical protein